MTNPTARIPIVSLRSNLSPPEYVGAGLTHLGNVRAENEDAILTDPTGTLWAVADGMGGYGHGDVASDIVTQEISKLGDNVLATPALRTALHSANALIQNKSREPGMGKMGATVVAIMLQNAVAHVVWAGDCRAYLMRQRHLRLLTRDHTVVQDMIDQGLLRGEEREGHPESHVVTRAVGYQAEIKLDAVAVPIVVGDRLLLCSDGLTACLGDHELGDCLESGISPRDVCERLIKVALARGAPDNVSVVSVFVQESEL